MVHTYWHVGRLIVEQEQQGAERAEYGKQQLEQLSGALQTDFDRGFDVSNLRNMRRFYLTFPIQDALRPELSWTHYRSLIRLESSEARRWYLNETVEQNWSGRSAPSIMSDCSPAKGANLSSRRHSNRHKPCTLMPGIICATPTYSIFSICPMTV